MPTEIFRLLTNIEQIEMGATVAIRLHCHALLLELSTNIVGEMSGKIRGFMTDGASPVFTHPLKCGPLEYEATAASSPHALASTDGTLKSLFTGHNLVFKDGTELSLIAQDQGADLQVADYTDIKKVWEELPHKVLQHWVAPNFPVTCHLPRTHVADFLRRQAA